MNSRRKPSARTSQLSFEALSIEGGLLSPEWLARLAQLDAGQQAEPDYRVPRGLNLRDEIGRFWRIAQAHWSDFDHGRARHAEPVALGERFVTSLLKDVFGFGSLKPSEPVEREGRLFPVTTFALGTRVPVVIAAADSGLDTPSPRFGEAGRKRSAFGLAQEFLNATDEALWGIACDGVTLRILRDNASLTRPAWIEADLGRIFAEERYADFAALWLLVHETRFGNAEASPPDCPLETWRTAGREEGTRARDHLRRGVEDALLAFGQGFIAHPDNAALRASIEAGTLSRMAFYQELLRLAYRLIFLITAEERWVLHAPDASATARALYEQGYSLRRLRERSVRRSAHDRFTDLWEGLKIVFRGAARGEPALALPALGGLFSEGQCPSLDGAKLTNSHLLLGVFKLSWLLGSTGLSRVNWRDMGPEELGSVYESLLELVPQVSLEGRRFSFATGAETKGNARKTSGSYYTPDSLVQVLLDSALEPVVKDTIAANQGDPVEALLSLSVVDPACGSGHFLLAAARRLAVHVARLQASGTPSAAQYRHALRQVVGRCIYGVDLNPMAVELCKVSLWMEAVEPGLPLSFLDSHVQMGNALFGATPELLERGIPDTAWAPIEGDDRKVAAALKKRNKAPNTRQLEIKTGWVDSTDAYSELARNVEAVDRSADDDLDSVVGKAKTWGDVLTSPSFRHQKFVADSWCAAFVWPKPPPSGDSMAFQAIKRDSLVESAPTNDLWLAMRDQRRVAPELTASTTKDLAQDYQFFHWHLAFPQVFARGGFDVVLGNPPWEHVEVKEQEWFAVLSSEISGATNAAMRKRMIDALKISDPDLHAEFAAALRLVDGENAFYRSSGRFPLCARGRINTYALFAEHNRALLRADGLAGFIVPSGIATDDNTRFIFQSMISDRMLVSLWEFENDGFFTAGKGHMLRFALLTVAGRSIVECAPDFFFQGHSVTELSLPSRHFSLSPEDIEAINPNSLNCPIFQFQRDAALNAQIYRRTGVLWRENVAGGNPWDLSFMQGVFNMASDSEIFRDRSQLEALGGDFDSNEFRALPRKRGRWFRRVPSAASLLPAVRRVGRRRRSARVGAGDR
ncbi:MAG: restriction endonuclease, partial [Myxococcaceae bacterium]